MKLEKIKGIIFDMDNTLLHSKIDFGAMKQGIFQLLAAHKILEETFNYSGHTTSQLIEKARDSRWMTRELETLVWQTVSRYEQEGMHGVTLEPGAVDVLEYLCKGYHLAVLTNNAQKATLTALDETGISRYFHHIAAREQMTALKPSPSGVCYILEKYPAVPAGYWLLVGDSWIDGKAAQDGGIKFLAYRGDLAEMQNKQVYPLANITHLAELRSFL